MLRVFRVLKVFRVGVLGFQSLGFLVLGALGLFFFV